MQNNPDTALIALKGRIDSGNASEVEKNILSQLEGKPSASVVLDAAELEYISSAGLRVLLRIKKAWSDLTIRNVNSEVYEILEMTGFTEMMKVEKAYRVVSVEGCEEIGRGANGTIYRIDRDNVVKVYNDENALEDIRHEQEVARLALILGLPTAISYDVVRVGNSYGSVFELLNARSFSGILAEEPDKMDWCVKEYVELLHKIHGTLVPAGKLPDMKDTFLDWANYIRPHLPEEAADKLIRMVKEVPRDNHMIHGDYHTKNVVLQNDEVLIIDMDTLAVGNPVFELPSMYNAFVGFSELDHGVVKEFQGFDYETSTTFWKKVLAEYLGTHSPSKLREVEDKTRILGYTRLIRRGYRRNISDSEEGRASLEYWTKSLLELLGRIDTLLFSPDELEVDASAENLDEVQSFVEERLEGSSCSAKTMMKIAVAVEEIFANIANYAYAPDRGKAEIRVEVLNDPDSVTITFTDRGMPYDPLANEDPDVTLPADERPIGGLGVYLVKQTMDDVRYEYKDGKNILTIKKSL